MFIAILTWFTTGRRNFTGPPSTAIVGTVLEQNVAEDSVDRESIAETKANMQ